MFQKIRKIEFIRPVIILMSGTVIAQVFNYLIAPILSRIYTEVDMADLGLYLRIVTFVSAIATARFELSLPLPKSESHSFQLYRLALRISKFVVLGCFFFFILYVLFFQVQLKEILFLLLILLSIIFLVFINLGTNWAIRLKAFDKIAGQRIINSVGSNSFKLAFGFLHWGGLGLIFATFIGYIVSSVGFIKAYVVKSKSHPNSFSPSKTFVLFKEYKNFPLYSLPHVLMDLGRDLAVGFFIVYHFGKPIFGSYVYATMMLGLPIALIGQSLGQVFFNKCSELINQNKSIESLVRKTLITLILFSFVPFGILFFFGEELFGFVFGKTWLVAGKFAEIMSLSMMINFIVSPLSNLPLILNRQRENLIFGVLNATIQIVLFGVLPFFYTDEINFTTILLITSLLLMGYYFAFGLYIHWLSKKRNTSLQMESSN